MDEKALKKVIKSLVRESLTEIFAEMNLEKLVESAVKRNISTAIISEKPSRSQVNEVKVSAPRPSKPVVNDVEKKRKLKEVMGVNDDMWNGIYGDISDNNPIMEHRDSVGPGQQASGDEVPESVLEDMGLMKDYSKHLGGSTVAADDDEWEERRKQREKIMNENFKRAR